MKEKKSFSELIKGDKPVLVDFFATWCGPCKAMQPVLSELSQEIQDEAHIIKVDVDKNPAVAEHFQIRGVPTFMVFKEGKIKWRHSGMMPKSQLKEVLTTHA